ncbi:MAG TPA: hypothetical protein VEY91_11450 [Candidatus Limnocylindria bacterium]|nr:hypothetical protein [Candidatus Limnocylindria bacterium]
MLTIYASTEDEAIVISELVRHLAALHFKDPDAVVTTVVGGGSPGEFGIEALPAFRLNDDLLCEGELPSFEVVEEWVRALPEDTTGRGDGFRASPSPKNRVLSPSVWVRLRLEDRVDDAKKLLEEAAGLSRLDKEAGRGPARSYFPPGALCSHSSSDAREAIRHARMLRLAEELPFGKTRRSDHVERYRLLWEGVVVRLDREARGVRITSKIFRMGDGGHLLSVEETFGSIAEWEAFDEALRETCFWSPTLTHPAHVHQWGWIIEGEKDGRYRAVTRMIWRELSLLLGEFGRLAGISFGMYCVGEIPPKP